MNFIFGFQVSQHVELIREKAFFYWASFKLGLMDIPGQCAKTTILDLNGHNVPNSIFFIVYVL